MFADRQQRTDSVSGFTLLEVVVALAIAALALVVLFRAGSSGLFATDGAARASEAVERAKSHLAAFGRSGATTAGEFEGDDGGGYHWKLRASPVAQHPAVGQPAGGLGLPTRPQTALALYDVEVTISWAGGGRTKAVVLATRRVLAAPVAK